MSEPMTLSQVLRGGRQCDEDGTEIIMSREACCVAADELEANAARIKELEAHANELAATCHARDETIHKHWCKVAELESSLAAAVAGKEAAERDVERMQWMSEHWGYAEGMIFFEGFNLGANTTLREAIDAAKEQP